MGKLPLSALAISRIKDLRLSGYSMPEIANELHISKSTVFRYAKDLETVPEIKKLLASKRGGSAKRKAQKIEKALIEAQTMVGELTFKEKLLFISALYWAEGSKGDFGLSNTDPKLVKVFINGLRDVLGITDDMFRISIRIYEDLDKEECLKFWSNVTGIPVENFVNVDILHGKKIGKLQYGMCRVRVAKGGDILKKIMSINDIVAKNMVP